MIITAWIILSCIIVFILIQTILLIANAKYREKVSTIFEKWRSVLIASIMIVILLYTLGTCTLIILFGDCYVGYYGSEGIETLYYDGSWYYQIADSNFTIISDFYEYGNGHWICTNTYISQAPVDFPYFEYRECSPLLLFIGGRYSCWIHSFKTHYAYPIQINRCY